MANLDTNTGAKRARETREFAGLAAGTRIDCLLTFVEVQMQVPVIIAALPAAIAGACCPDDDGSILWVNGTQPPSRQRFTLAHELGHLRCRHDGNIPPETYMTIGGKPTDAREVQANAFAAELLAPKDLVAEHATNGDAELEDVLRLAADCGISPIAALFRFNRLGLVSRYEELRVTIEAGDHEPLPAGTDAIATVDALPRFSPVLEGSALAAVASGNASTEASALSAGCDADALARAAGRIAI